MWFPLDMMEVLHHKKSNKDLTSCPEMSKYLFFLFVFIGAVCLAWTPATSVMPIWADCTQLRLWCRSMTASWGEVSVDFDSADYSELYSSYLYRWCIHTILSCRKFHGYSSLKEYYEKESCVHYIHNVRVQMFVQKAWCTNINTITTFTSAVPSVTTVSTTVLVALLLLRLICCCW